MNIIKLYGKGDNSFEPQVFGDINLQPLKAIVHNADNGDFYIDCELGLEYANEIQPGRIIVAMTPQGEQAFRISDATKTRKRVTFRAWHVYYDTENIVLTTQIMPGIPLHGVPILNPKITDYLTTMFSYLDPSSNSFTATSDITSNVYTHLNRGSMFDAINRLIDYTGGHLVRDNFTFAINASIGSDKGITIRYGSNMKDITVAENWDAVCTRCYPVGKDGTRLDAPGYVESSTQYTNPYTKQITFEQDIDREDYASDAAYIAALKADLQAQAQAYVNNACYPQVNYTLHANLDTPTDIGDTIQVMDTRLGINLLTSVISYDYDAISEQYKEIEFGNFRKTMAGFASSIVSSASNNAVAQVSTDVAGQIAAAKLEMFPIGSIYMSVNSTDPASFIGGTWERIQDTFLLAAGSTYSAGATGGEATHTLTEAEMPYHRHSYSTAPQSWGERDTSQNQVISPSSGSAKFVTKYTNYSGGQNGTTQPHNNMPPYLAVYVWQRTA